jgi:hypothetical protein
MCLGASRLFALPVSFAFFGVCVSNSFIRFGDRQKKRNRKEPFLVSGTGGERAQPISKPGLV